MRWLSRNWELLLFAAIIVAGIALAVIFPEPAGEAQITFGTSIQFHTTPTVEAVDPHNCYEEGPLECPCAPELGEDD